MAIAQLQKSQAAANAKVLLYINLPQDLDLLLPLTEPLKANGYCPRLVVSSKAWQNSPQTKHQLKATNLELSNQLSVLNHKAVVAGFRPSLRGVQALITASESTAAAHRGPHALTKRANRRGIATYTLQHGLENVGLTYFDDEHPVGQVMFASKTIFTWGPTAHLPAETPKATKAKCIAAGCPKIVRPPEPAVPIPELSIPNYKRRDRLIVIFENLHWSRYSDRYRQQFLQDLGQAALTHSKTTFIIRTHPTGLWTQRHLDRLPSASNLVLADPSSDRWRAVTAATLIALADITITTPSTIALDAARAGCPVAVAAYGLSLPNFEPLPLLQHHSDWQALMAEPGQSLAQKSEQFARSRLMPGDAVGRIISQIAADLKR